MSVILRAQLIKNLTWAQETQRELHEDDLASYTPWKSCSWLENIIKIVPTDLFFYMISIENICIIKTSCGRKAAFWLVV